jgi:hypothetical protein
MARFGCSGEQILELGSVRVDECDPAFGKLTAQVLTSG